MCAAKIGIRQGKEALTCPPPHPPETVLFNTLRTAYDP